MFYLMCFICFMIGVVSGIFLISLCSAAKRSDLEAKIYELRSKLSEAQWNNRETALKDTD